MKISGKIKDIMIDIETRKPILTLEIDGSRDVLQDANELIYESLLDIEIKKHRKKRSLSANAYAWVMIDKLAETLSIPKERIYQNIIKNIGGNSTYVRVKKEAYKKLIDNWGKNGLGWCGEIIDENDSFCDVALYYGSSTYDTKQMSRFIELIVQECRELGLSTDTLERKAYFEGLLQCQGV